MANLLAFGDQIISSDKDGIISVTEHQFDNLPNTAEGLYAIDDGTALPLNTEMIGYGDGNLDDALDYIGKCIIATASNVSALPVTINNSNITSSMVVVNTTLSDPTAQTDNWTWTTSNGSVQISGTISGTTNITLYLIESVS